MKCLKCKGTCLSGEPTNGGLPTAYCFSCSEQYRVIDGNLYPYRRKPTELELNSHTRNGKVGKVWRGLAEPRGGELG
jgi:hypothetical protein